MITTPLRLRFAFLTPGASELSVQFYYLSRTIYNVLNTMDNYNYFSVVLS
jgi:hypothetical protein